MRRLTSLIGQTVITVLLMLVAATPALAELGCFEDTRTHAQQVVSTELAAFALGEAGDENKSGPLEMPTHCAFSHCAHVLAAPATDQNDVGSDFGETPYSLTLAQPLAAAARDGPEYPPRT